MTDEQRTTKLDWIRDGMKWVVAISAGLIGVSSTYYYDRFDQAPRWELLLFIGWASLGIAAFGAIWAAFSAWQNVGKTGSFGRHITWSYAVAMYTFVLGLLAVGIVLAANVKRVRKKETSVAMFSATIPLPSFAPASATPLDPTFVAQTCAARKALADSNSSSAVVIGRYDRRELSAVASTQFKTNSELAQARADRVAKLLSEELACPTPPIRNSLTLIGGPRLPVPAGAPRIDVDRALASDRTVEVYGFRPVRH